MKMSKRTAQAGFSFIAAMLVSLVTLQVEAAPPVQVTAADPPSAPQGTIALDVAVSGSGFDSSAAVDFFVTGTTSPGGITVKKVTVLGPKKLIAKIDIADAALIANFDIQVSLSGGRKGKGTSLFAVQAKTSDPCAALNLDFPAFSFLSGTAQGTEIYIADATGQCIRPVFELTGVLDSGNAPAFSYPIAGTTDVGRVAWVAHDNVYFDNLIYVLTFQVTGTSISIGTLDLLYDSYPVPLGSLDLSEDGTTVYFTLGSLEPSGSKHIMAIDVDSANVQEMFVGPPDGSGLDNIAVSEDGAFFVRQDRTDLGLPSKLLRIGPSCNNPTCWVVLAEAPPGAWGANFPAASLVDDRLAYVERVPNLFGCWLLQIIPDTGGPILNSSAQPRYGKGGLTWYGNKILTDGFKPPNRQGRCASTGIIMQIDPDTNAETPLVRGYAPDGR